MKKVKQILVVLIILVALLTLGERTASYLFKNKVLDEIKLLYDSSLKADKAKVTEAGLKKLPGPVAGYLRASGVVGKQRIKFARVKETGAIRSAPDAKWMTFTADQFFSSEPMGFIWLADVSMGPVPVKVRDIYFNGKGNMLVKLASTFSIADAKGKEIDKSAFGRCFGELSLLPTAFLNKNIKWENKGKGAVRASIKDRENEVVADMKFNDKNELVEYVCDRYRDENGTIVPAKFMGRCSNYREFKGFRIPGKISGSWVLPSGEFEYVWIEINNIEYE